MTFRNYLSTLALLFSSLTLSAQTLTQTIRGTVVDKISQTTLPGASVVLVNSNPLIGTTTDPDGNFKLTQIAVGTHALRISFIGYKEIIIPNIVVNSGKEVVLTIPIEEDVTQLTEIVVRPDVEKNQPINEMATVSTRTFSVEETRKFAAAVNDPARAAISFAGVVSADDGNNSISIRGNSPVGLLWRMEGVDIPNPNHFADVGSSGGGISILSSQLLANSDFSTGAFPAEYGNALAGVFDLNLRKGNNEKREYTIQAGFLGLDVAAEGPFAKNYRGSYLINYRYSTLSVLSQLGVKIGDAVTNFQDLSYNIFLPTNKFGNFSLFGFGGLSDQNQNAKKDSTQWEEDYQRYSFNYFSNTGAAGFKHAITLSPNTFLQSSVVLSGNNHGFQNTRLDNDYNPQFNYKENYTTQKITFSSVLNHKFNAKNSIRSGMYLNRYTYKLLNRHVNPETDQVEESLNSAQYASTEQLFSQWNYRPTDRLTVNTGVHLLYLNDNSTYSVEPRVSMKYNLNNQQSLNLGYGLHSQMQPVGVYEAQIEQPDGSYTQPNKNLGFNKAHHFVLGYDRSLTKYLRVKAETYYQQLFNIAVENDPTSPISSLVVEEGFATLPMVNKGTGHNYGLELTVEQFLHNNLYFLFSGSLYNSEYKALDNVWRNTRFNGKHALSFTAGKEYLWKKNRVFGLNLRTIYTGGFWSTPIDYEKSQEVGETRYVESLAFTEQLPDYFRMDFRVSLKRNRPNSTTTLSLDLQNATNNKNLGGQYYEPQSGEIKKWYMLPLLPILSYRIEF
ncbi:MAG TPA: TonB-dependent receptor [Cyclobacteriaceae bacterium]|nr:TonB-dependent receptor [Cyclobacteriaceae bacterium]